MNGDFSDCFMPPTFTGLQKLASLTLHITGVSGRFPKLRDLPCLVSLVLVLVPIWDDDPTQCRVLRLFTLQFVSLTQLPKMDTTRYYVLDQEDVEAATKGYGMHT
jgi:hypothetical protein